VVERLAVNQSVVGSSPTGGAITELAYFLFSLMGCLASRLRFAVGKSQ
jgi:hypothetical protein